MVCFILNGLVILVDVILLKCIDFICGFGWVGKLVEIFEFIGLNF